MKLRPLFFVTFALCAGLLAAAQPTHTLKEVKGPPKGLSEKIAAEMNPAGWSVVTPDGPVVEIWFAKGIEVKPGFSPSFNVKYPFQPGQLVGALNVPEKSGFTDFRGQELPAGAYTLRYGQQPEDGNHIGTSATADFLLALPAKVDTDTKPIAGFDPLSEKSAASIPGGTHPAIFSLLPVEKKAEKPGLVHNEDRDYRILEATVDGKAKDKAMPVPVRLIVIGRSEV
ncbi:MAG: hypothetical protein KY476_13350 [Planctomycetes bacterium]|nr:hypothetical protein [Planctomycetota bacterium]